MKKILLLPFFLLIGHTIIDAQNDDLSKEIVGDWIFQYSEAKELLVDNQIVKDDILANIANNKILLGDQVLNYSSDSTLKVIYKNEISEGTYVLDGNVATYTFDTYSYHDIISIEGDTLRVDHDQTEYYQQQVAGYYLTDRDNSTVSKAIVSYIYLRKKD